MEIETLREKMDDHLALVSMRRGTRPGSGTRQKYHQALNKFYRANPSLEFSRDAIKSFLATLARNEFKKSTVRYHYFFLRTLVENVIGDDWPLKKGDAPPEPQQRDLYQPIFATTRIKQMIKRVGKARLLSFDLTRFAISTTYGARRIELAELGEDSIDLDLKVVRIETRKQGDPRTHLLPDEIIPFLHPEKLKPVEESSMSEAFIRIEEALGFEHQKGFGFHSFRRRLATYFDDHDVSGRSIDIFMRWKPQKAMRRRYVVRTRLETSKVQAKVDRQIFKIHPFLSTWRGVRPII